MKNILNLQKSIITVITIALSYNAIAQDVQFTQALSNPLNLNPAMMGLNPDLKFALQYRNQFGAVGKGYATYSFSSFLPVYLKNDGVDKIDFGFNAMNDVAGAFNTLTLSLAAGYNLKLTESSYINVSFMGGFVQRSLNTSKLTFDQQYQTGAFNASNPNNESILNKTASYGDFSAGAMWYCAPVKINLGKERRVKAYLGTSVFHLNTPPNETFSGGTAALPRRFSTQAGIKFLGEKMDVTPNMYTNSQAGNTTVSTGLLLDYHIDVINKLSFGAWYRSKSAVAFCAGYTYLNYRLMYSYDIMHTSPISNSVSALQTHEVTLTINFDQAQKKGVKVVPSFFEEHY